MRGWSFPMGRWLGVDLRIHTFFVLLLAVCLGSANMLGVSTWRGFGMWLLLLLAVGVRELARGIAAAIFGLKLRNILFLPIGGLMAYRDAESVDRAAAPATQLRMALVGPLMNASFALVCWLTVLGIAPSLDLLARPLITPAHLIRSLIWLNLFLGLLHLLPAYPLDAGRVLRSRLARSENKTRGERTAVAAGQTLALLAVFAGIYLQSAWLILAGLFIFASSQLEDQGVLFQSVVDTVFMRDVMLTEFALLSPSDTLEDALAKSIHVLQDDFPVVRGGSLVGVVSRQSIAEALRADGNGYVQGVMQRAFHVASPQDSLGATISRFSGRGMSLVPVLEGETVVGIVTLQNLMHSMSLFAENRRLRRRE